MAAFEWNAGGEWGGKPWSAELPTDSALVFYLFASYLAAPQWLFPVEVRGAQPPVQTATGTGLLPACRSALPQRSAWSAAAAAGMPGGTGPPLAAPFASLQRALTVVRSPAACPPTSGQLPGELSARCAPA